MPIPYSRKIAIGFILAVFVLFIVGFFAFISVSELVSSNQRLTHSQEILAKLEDVYSDFLEAENTEKDRVITGTNYSDAEIVNLHKDILKKLAVLKSLVSSEPEQAARIEELRGLVKDALEGVNDTATLPSEKKAHSTRGLIIKPGQLSLLGKIKQIIHTAEQSEEKELNERIEKANQSLTITRLFILAGGMAAFTLLLISYILHKRDLGRSAENEKEIKILAHAMRSISEAVSIADKGNRIIFINDSFSKNYGYDINELKGKTLDIVMSPRNDAEVIEKLNAVAPNGGRKGEVLHRRKNGSDFPVFLSTSKVTDESGEIIASVEVVVDISNKKKEEKIKEAVYEIAEATNASGSLEELYDSIHGILNYVLTAKNFYIAVYNPQDGLMHFPYFADEYDTAPEPRPRRKGLTEYVLKTGLALFIRQESFPEILNRGEVELIGKPSVDWIGVPLKSGGETFGVMVVQSYNPEIRFSEEDLNMLEYVSAQVATAIIRKKAQDDLNKSEVRFRTIAETVSSGIIVYEADKFVYANGYTILFSGFPVAELMNMKVTDLVHPDQHEYFMNKVADQKFNPLRRQNYELKIITKKGAEKWIDVTSSVTVWNDKPALLAAFFDITQHKIYEEKIKSQNKFLNEVINSLTYPFYVIDVSDNTIINCNKSGMRGGAIVGRKYFDVLSFCNGEDENNVCGDLLNKVQETGKDYTVELGIKEEGDKDTCYEIHAYPVFGQGQTVSHVIIYMLNITERKKSEKERRIYIEQLKSSNALIEQNTAELMELNKKLTESSEKLKELNANKDKFFSIISHDLRSPFTSLLGFSSLLADDTDKLNNDQIREYSSGIYSNVKNILRLLDNLLEWSRIQLNRIVYNPEIINMFSMVDDVITLINGNAVTKKITILNNISEDLMVYADYEMVHSVVRNLISNAIKFTREHGTISIGGQKEKDYTEVFVKDTGIGMSGRAISKLFRIGVHHTTLGTAKERGTGLGLILCKELVEKNGGKIWAESKENEGTTFRFILPSGIESTDKKAIYSYN